jgi:hypothetical protein
MRDFVRETGERGRALQGPASEKLEKYPNFKTANLSAQLRLLQIVFSE